MTPEKVKESMEVRGVCAAIQAMSAPTFNNLRDLLEPFGYYLAKMNYNERETES